MIETETETTSKKRPQRQETHEEYPWTISFLLQDMKGDIKENTRRIEGINTRIDGLEVRIDGLSTRIDGLSTRIDSLASDMDARFKGVYTTLSIGFTIIAALIVVFNFV